MIHLIDYGLGNVQAFLTLYKRLGIKATRTNSAAGLVDAKKIILPGVGAFGHAMDLLNASGMRPILETLVMEEKVPILGVCVGMQMFASASEEGQCSGLGWVPGQVRSLLSDESAAVLPLPHMGWNDVQAKNNNPLFFSLNEGARFYFLHSYFFECDNPSDVAATAKYGLNFSCAIAAENVYGVQFHPEKSHRFGTQLLKNFAEL